MTSGIPGVLYRLPRTKKRDYLSGQDPYNPLHCRYKIPAGQDIVLQY
jgi:hypothetical protein